MKLLALLVAFAVAPLAACPTIEDNEIHLIPDGYVGPVIIVFNVADGVPQEHRGGARVYRIPDNGVLRTQFPPSSGWISVSYFYSSDHGGAATEIIGRAHSTIHDTPSNRESLEVGVLNPYDGTTAAPYPNDPNSYSSDSPCAVKFSGYFVGTKADFLEREEPFDISEYLSLNPVPCQDAA